MKFKRLATIMLTTMLAVPIISVDVKAEEQTGTLLLTNWFKPNNFGYVNKKFFNPYVQGFWQSTQDPAEIGELEHKLKKKNEDGTFTDIQLAEELPVGEYQLSPSSIGGSIPLENKDFTITEGEKTIVDLVYSYQPIKASFMFEDSKITNGTKPSLSYEVYSTKTGGVIDEKLYTGTTKDGELSILIDPGAYAVKVSGKGWFKFVAYSEEPELTKTIDVQTLLPQEEVIDITTEGGNNSSDDVVSNPSDEGNYNINSNSPPTSEMSRVNTDVVIGFSFITLALLLYIKVGRQRLREQQK